MDIQEKIYTPTSKVLKTLYLDLFFQYQLKLIMNKINNMWNKEEINRVELVLANL